MHPYIAEFLAEARLEISASRPIERLPRRAKRRVHAGRGRADARFGETGRLFGREGYAGGAWLNGETRAEGFSLDGRIERDGKAHNFKMNVEIDEWLRRAARWWSRGLTDL